jgi:AcrR family transcriptional regulator
MHVSEMQRRRLLLAVVEIVAQEGSEAATAGRVCERAHISRRTFYELFCDREDCLLSAFERELERLAERIVPAYESRQTWPERIRAGLQVLLEHFEDEPAVARMCMVEASRGPRVLEYRKRVLDTLTVAVDEGRRGSKAGIAPPQLTAESIVGGAISVIAGRLAEHDPRPLTELVNPLMGMIVFPYLGALASQAELETPLPVRAPRSTDDASDSGAGLGLDPFRDLPIRITFRTARVLATIAEQPGASNRQIGEAAGVPDQGQISKLLARLQRHELIANQGAGHAKGEANSWTLTQRGKSIEETIGVQREGK